MNHERVGEAESSTAFKLGACAALLGVIGAIRLLGVNETEKIEPIRVPENATEIDDGARYFRTFQVREEHADSVSCGTKVIKLWFDVDFPKAVSEEEDGFKVVECDTIVAGTDVPVEYFSIK